VKPAPRRATKKKCNERGKETERKSEYLQRHHERGLLLRCELCIAKTKNAAAGSETGPQSREEMSSSNEAEQGVESSPALEARSSASPPWVMAAEGAEERRGRAGRTPEACV
jgi:hypothetical protein